MKCLPAFLSKHLHPLQAPTIGHGSCNLGKALNMCFHEISIPSLFRPSLRVEKNPHLLPSNFHWHCCSPRVSPNPVAEKTARLLGLSLNNLIVKSPDTLVEVHFFERGFEVPDHLPEVVEEGAELNEAEINSAAKSFRKEAVRKEESDANLGDWCIIGQLILANANKSPRTKRLRHFGSEKLSWLRLEFGREVF